jgi:hypothetical protein
MEKLEDMNVEVGCTASNGIVLINLETSEGFSCMMFSPDQAVKLWRVMGSEQYNTLTAVEVDGKTRITVEVSLDKAGRITEDCGDMFTLQDDKGNIMLTLTPDQATALAWQIKRCCEEALNTDYPGGKKIPKVWGKIPKVWVLSWRRLLTGDAAGEGTELIGGSERVYMTKEGAMFDLPDLLRGFVKDSYAEGHFGPDEDGLGETVEEIMNEASTNGHPGRWLYDGSTQSFEVELSWIPVRP